MNEYDVVVVGAGSAGAVVAARLSENEDIRVLLLEAGPDFPDELESPPGFLTGGPVGVGGVGAPTPDLDWKYYSEPLAEGRRIHLCRGKVVGGSSMTNGCIAVRGRSSDFDRWEELGATGWGWYDVEPFYERAERELSIKRYAPESWLPIQRTFFDGCRDLGFRACDDLNAPDAWDDVVGPWPQNKRNEVRMGSLVTYVRAARPRPNFTLEDRALVDCLLVRGSRVHGVRYVDASGVHREVHTDQVVLSAGAYGTPLILMRSGVGPPEMLRRAGIDCTVDLPVGEGLMDHPSCRFHVDTPLDLARIAGPSLAVAARGPGWWATAMAADETTGRCIIAFGLEADHDSGSIAVTSPDPQALPTIDHRLRDSLEYYAFRDVWAAYKNLVESPTFRAAGITDADNDRDLHDLLEERLTTAYHYAGTAAIGKVVDSDLRVLGLDGCRVADASVFPKNVSNNTNLTCFMVGEYAAEKLQQGDS